MSIVSFEQALVDEAREQTGDRTLTRKRLMEWSSIEIPPHTDETTFKLNKTGVWVSFENAAPKAGKK